MSQNDGAEIATLNVLWRVAPTEMVLDARPRLLLLVEAIRDTTLAFLKVEARDLDGQPGPSVVLGRCPPAYGVRRFKVQSATPGKPFVRACGNFLVRPAWEVLEPLLSWDIPAGSNSCLWAGYLQEARMMPGFALGLVASCQEPCKVKVEMCGV